MTAFDTQLSDFVNAAFNAKSLAMIARKPNACPVCNSTSLTHEVVTWMNFQDGAPESFDDSDLSYVQPMPNGETICRDCQHTGKLGEFENE